MAANPSMSPYYRQCHEDALEFQDFVCRKLITIGVLIQNYSSRKYQHEHGENVQGFEIKYDRRLEKTGNVFFETAEKATDRSGDFVPSGILRQNHWIYVIGNYKELFLFDSNRLREIWKRYASFQKKYPDDTRRIDGVVPEGFSNATSQGFLISRRLILDLRLCSRHLSFEVLSLEVPEEVPF